MDKMAAQARADAITAARRALLIEKLSKCRTALECIKAALSLSLTTDQDSLQATRARAIALAGTSKDIHEIAQFPYSTGAYEMGALIEAYFERAMLICSAEEIWQYSVQFKYLSPAVIDYLVAELSDPLMLTALAWRIKGTEWLARTIDAAGRAADLAATWEACERVAENHTRPLPADFLIAAVVLAEREEGHKAPLAVCAWISETKMCSEPVGIREKYEAGMLVEWERRAIRTTEVRIRASYNAEIAKGTDEALGEAWRLITEVHRTLPELAVELMIELESRLKKEGLETKDFSKMEMYLAITARMEGYGRTEAYSIMVQSAKCLASKFEHFLHLIAQGIEVQTLTEKALTLVTSEREVLELLQQTVGGDWLTTLCQQIFNERLERAATVEDYLILHHLTKDPALVAGVEEKIQELIAPYLPATEE